MSCRREFQEGQTHTEIMGAKHKHSTSDKAHGDQSQVLKGQGVSGYAMEVECKLFFNKFGSPGLGL